MTDKFEMRTRTDLTPQECSVIDAMRKEGLDPLVEVARGLNVGALLVITRNNRYNKNGIKLPDNFPSGIRDYLRMIMEPTIRVWASGDHDQAVDTIGYINLTMAMMLTRGEDKGQFSGLIDGLVTKYYQLLKEHDIKTGEVIDADYRPPETVEA